MERVCFLSRVRPDRLAEYRARHAAVWAQWQAQMSSFFADIGGQRPDEAFTRLPEIFHLA